MSDNFDEQVETGDAAPDAAFVPDAETRGDEEGKEPGKQREKKVKISRKELEEVKAKAAKSDECFDQLLRLKAEFDNYRKRINKEREEYTAYAVEEIVADFLEVIDNLERALSAAGESGDFTALYRGVEITYKDSMKVLGRWGVKEVSPLGEEFDPGKHEAVEHVDSDDDDGKVVEVLRKGYLLKERLLRPALVKVGRRIKNGQDDRN